MRVSLKRGVQWVLVILLVHLAVYYWSYHKGAKPIRAKKPHRYLAAPQWDTGTCSFENCPEVKEDMLNVHLVPHSHIDVGWLKTVDQYYTGDNAPEDQYYNPKLECVRCTLNTTITELLKNPNRRFIFVEMIYLARFWKEASNAQRETILQLIKERRLEIINGGWIMSDAGVTMYNDLIDQHTLGFDFIRDTFGPCAHTKTAWHVDQFGHSREHASILAQMGYDSLFVGRIDFRDHDNRKENKNLEFVWETSPNNYGKKSTLFTQATYDGYYAPPSFVLDGVTYNMFSNSRQGNVRSFVAVIRSRAKAFKTNHLIVPMGSDFGYSNATSWYSNMDVLIDTVNKQDTSGSMKLNFIYSTPSCYVHYVNQANATFVTKQDDFHPYGISPGVYWTGYFTSRGGFKMHIKKAGQILQSCKQMSILLGLQGTFKKVHKLRNAMAIMQHHDAITGTQKKHVLNDYNRILSHGVRQCQSVMSIALQRLWSKDGTLLTLSSHFCHNLNISSCEISEAKEQFLLTVYNPLSWTVEKWIRIPVSLFELTITTEGEQPIPYQLVNIPKSIRDIPERISTAEVEAVFKVTLPPFSSSGFLVKPERGGVRPPNAVSSSQDTIIENEHISLTFNGKSGLLTKMVNKDSQIELPLSQDYYFYEGEQGGMRASGAYVFIPESATPVKVSSAGKPVKIKLVKGDLVQEVHQTFSTWVSQIIRLYAGARYVEIQWVVGPIPTEDGSGKEVISKFTSDIHNYGKFFTDSNGREMLERTRDHRDTWEYEVMDKISGNYYPVTSRIFLKDEKRNIQLTVMPDRPLGGSSINDGTLEMMVHRKLLFDDSLGVGEPLDDKGIDHRGIIFTGKQYVVLDTIKNSAELTRHLSLQLHFNPPILFAKNVKGDGKLTSQVIKQHTFLNQPLPPNVQVLSLDYIAYNETDQYLLRLEHVFEANEHLELSKPATVSLQELFKTFDIVSIEETTLGGNFHPKEISKLKWLSEKGPTSPDIGSSDVLSTVSAPFKITLQPMEIRTFRIQVDRER